MYISATMLNKNPGKMIDEALRKPVIIRKQGKPTVALIDYEYFILLEDVYWGKTASEIEKNPEWLTAAESEDFLQK